MKKLAVFLFIFAILGVCFALPKQTLSFLPSAKAACVVTDYWCAQKLGFDYLPSGNQALISVDAENLQQIYQQIKPYCVLLKYDSNQLQSVKNAFSITNYYVQTLQNQTIVYAFSPKIKDFRFVDGKKINVQIVVDESDVLVGIPMIMTGF